MIAEAQVTITPKMMAEAFWGMCDREQAQFLQELAKTIKAYHESTPNSLAWGFGEMQWYHLEHALREPEYKQAREMLMSMSAPLYLHTLEMTG